jgi:YHYH protein
VRFKRISHLGDPLAAQVDAVGGPSHLVGVAAEGFPVYGDKDIHGATVMLAQLDACNGITSATPEFPGGVYHYVLPTGVTGFQSSLRCYSGTVTKTQLAALKSTGICEVPRTAVASLQERGGIDNADQRWLNLSSSSSSALRRSAT